MHSLLGPALALGAALVWSISIILFKHAETTLRPLGMNLFKNVLGAFLLGLTMLVTGHGIDFSRSTDDWIRLCLSGVLGMAVADTAIFMALRQLGPGLLAIVDCSYAPTIVGMSVLFLGESLSTGFLLGAFLVVLGVTLATLEEVRIPQTVANPKHRIKGIALGVFGIVSMAIGVILAKAPLERSSLVEVTFIRLIAGVVAQIIWIVVIPSERTSLRVFIPQKAHRTLVPAAILGAYISLLLWLGGFKWASASVAAVLNQMSSVFTILFARIFLKEPLTRMRSMGGVVAIAGALIVLLR